MNKNTFFLNSQQAGCSNKKSNSENDKRHLEQIQTRLPNIASMCMHPDAFILQLKSLFLQTFEWPWFIQFQFCQRKYLPIVSTFAKRFTKQHFI